MFNSISSRVSHGVPPEASSDMSSGVYSWTPAGVSTIIQVNCTRLLPNIHPEDYPKISSGITFGVSPGIPPRIHQKISRGVSRNICLSFY